MGSAILAQTDRSAAADDVAIVLLHGYLCLSRFAYWQGLLPLRRALATAGQPVVIGCAPRTGSIATRAGRLARFLSTLPHRRLVLVGHSMGGLDARFTASRLDPDRRISRVITIGTPHRGSAAAEWVLAKTRWPATLLRTIDRGALRDLTRDGARRLNRLMPDRADVGYRSLVGVYSGDLLAEPFRALAAHVAAEEGDNDGLVSIHSASRWPEPVTLRAHHLGLIGQPLRQGFDWRWSSPQADQRPLAELLLPSPILGTPLGIDC